MKSTLVAIGAIAASLVFSASAYADLSVVADAHVTLASAKAGNSTAATLDAAHWYSDGTDWSSGSKPPQATDLRIALPKGATLNADIADECDLGELEETGECPSGAYLGKGTGDVNVSYGGYGILRAKATIYRVSCDSSSPILCIAIDAVEPETGTRAQLVANVIKKGGLVQFVLPHYSLPEILDIETTLVHGHFVLDASRKIRMKIFTRKHGKKRAKTVRRKGFLVNNPLVCKGKWTYELERNFANGQDIVNDVEVPCKK